MCIYMYIYTSHTTTFPSFLLSQPQFLGLPAIQGFAKRLCAVQVGLRGSSVLWSHRGPPIGRQYG